MPHAQPVTVAVIPARGGSKSIPRKNLADLGGRPLLARAIEGGLACPEISRVIVSTDDAEIAAVGREYGAEVPFLRPAELAADDTPDLPVFRHLLSWLLENEEFACDFLVNLRCTTPLRRPEHIGAAVRALAEAPGADSLRSVDRIQGKHHPYWMFAKDDEGFSAPFVAGIDVQRDYYRRQLLPPAWSINALVDVMRPSVIFSPQGPYGERMLLLETDPIFSIDIDTPKDLVVCRALWDKLDELAS
jgi:CMP-N-acetylneuraminic acid synthetase